MTREVAETAIRFGHQNSTDHLDVSFFGGEPFLESDLLFETIAYARAWRKSEGLNLPLRFFSTTNGLLLDEKLLGQCHKEKITLSLSLDGHGSCHDATRPRVNGTGSFDHIASHFPQILHYYPNIQILSTYTPKNIDRLAEGIEKLYYCGFRYFTVGLNYEEPWSDNALESMQREYERLGRFYVDRYESGQPVSISLFDSRIASHVNSACERCSCCDKNDGEIAVAPSGNIYPCLRLVKTDEDHTLLLGNVKTGMDRKLRAKIMLEAGREWSECLACGHRGRCFHYCSAVNFKVNGRFNQPPHILCLQEQCAIAVADNIATHLYKAGNPHFLKRFYP